MSTKTDGKDPATEFVNNALSEGEINREIERLAALPPLLYENQRTGSASMLDMRVSVLDQFVKARRAKERAKEKAPDEEIKPADEPVAGDQLLNAIKDRFEQYLVLPAHAPVAMALWVMHTWTIEAADISPILALVSPEPRCGKTTALKILNRLTCRAEMASNISTAALFRFIDAQHPTLLIDEADTFMKENEAMRGILNSGHSRDAAYAIRCDGEDMELRKFSTWGPKAIAGIKKMHATLIDRSIGIAMRRKKTNEVRPRYRDRDMDCSALRSQALRWSQDNIKALTEKDPAVPQTLNDRAADNWRPLLAIADVAGGNWPELGRKAAIALSGATDDTLGVRLLRDIRWIFQGKPEPDLKDKGPEPTPTTQMFSKHLVEELVAIEGSPWADWLGNKGFTQNALARQLDHFGISPKTIRIGMTTLKGYEVAWFAEAFAAYVDDTSPPTEGETTVTTSQPPPNGPFSHFQTVTPQSNVTDEKLQKYRSNGHCDGVTVQKDLAAKDKAVAADDMAQADADSARCSLCGGLGELVEVAYRGKTAALHRGCMERWLETQKALAARVKVTISEIYIPATNGAPNSPSRPSSPTRYSFDRAANIV